MTEFQGGGRGTRSLAPDCDSALRHSELVSESLNKGKDSGSEAGMTKAAGHHAPHVVTLTKIRVYQCRLI